MRSLSDRSCLMPEQHEPVSERLLDRVRWLEQQQIQLKGAYRRLRLMTGALLLVAGAGVLMGQTAALHKQSLEAQEFVLRGSDGKVRGAMGIADNGATGISLHDSKGVTRITIDLATDGSPGIDLY